jgi:hypothetical protein
MRDSRPITTNQAVRAFRRLSAEDSQRIAKAAEKLQERTGMRHTEALQVLAAIGKYLVLNDRG